MTSRQIQLGSFSNPILIKQDHELICYLKDHSYQTVYGHGDIDYFRQFVNIVDHRTDFGIYIVNETFEYRRLIDHVNWVIENRINHGLYLAINKFFAVPTDEFRDLDADYDIAIGQLMRQKIDADIDSYQYQSNDRGQFFNFVHPLSRFYLSKS